MRQLVYYVAVSADGFVADAQGDFSAFPQDPETLAALFDRHPETCPAHLRKALRVSDSPKRFDTVLMGYRTLEPALTAGLTAGAYPQLRQLVATHQELGSVLETISGDVAEQVAALKSEPGRDLNRLERRIGKPLRPEQQICRVGGEPIDDLRRSRDWRHGD